MFCLHITKIKKWITHSLSHGIVTRILILRSFAVLVITSFWPLITHSVILFTALFIKAFKLLLLALRFLWLRMLFKQIRISKIWRFFIFTLEKRHHRRWDFKNLQYWFDFPFSFSYLFSFYPLCLLWFTWRFLRHLGFIFYSKTINEDSLTLVIKKHSCLNWSFVRLSLMVIHLFNNRLILLGLLCIFGLLLICNQYDDCFHELYHIS